MVWVSVRSVRWSVICCQDGCFVVRKRRIARRLSQSTQHDPIHCLLKKSNPKTTKKKCHHQWHTTCVRTWCN